MLRIATARGVRLAAFLVPTLALVAPLRAEDLKADLARGLKLLRDGNELADKGDTTTAQVRYQEAFQQILPGLRRLPFKHEVKRDVTAREELKDYLIKDLEADMTPEEFEANELGLKALGFIPRDMDWKSVLLKVYSEEVAGFYDPRTKTMHLIKEPEEKEKKPPTFLERLLGRTGGFDKDEAQTVMAHELTHALADQHFDLQALHELVKNDDDMDLALSALIEGEATLTMMGAQMKDWDGALTKELPAEDLDRTFSLVGAFLPMLGGKGMQSAPPILKESMLFPYIRGLVFCAKLVNGDGWKGIDQAYRSPPVSTEQVLHLDKYKINPDPPQAIDLGELEPGPGWKELGRNVVGELQLTVLLRGREGKRAAAGWDGDRYAVFKGPNDRLGLVWLSTWDSESDAKEFSEAYAQFQTSKLGNDAQAPDEVGESLRRDHGGATYLVERRGRDVAVIEGFPDDSTRRLLDAAFLAKKSEKSWEGIAAAAKP